MIDKTIFQFILDKCNDASINTQEVLFKGNYVFVRMNDVQTLLVPDTNNPFDLKQQQYVGMAEAVSDPQDYVEANNRTGWTKQYVFQMPTKLRDKTLVALQQVYDYLKANNVQSITDDGTVYKLILKPTRPQFLGNQQQAGGISTTYGITIYAETIETGYYGNETTHQMALNGGTLQDLIIDKVTISNGTGFDPSNDLTNEENTENAPVSRGITFNMTLYYDSTTLLETLLKIIQGKHSREQIFDYSVNFDSVTQPYDLYVSGGSVVMKNGTIIQLKLTFVEV